MYSQARADAAIRKKGGGGQHNADAPNLEEVPPEVEQPSWSFEGDKLHLISDGDIRELEHSVGQIMLRMNRISQV